ncbi:MAG: hypothetical protein N3A38_07095 [Planctomycetota bacterium]|nr:hypothetical protein [Planctomycetota bacterium]
MNGQDEIRRANASGDGFRSGRDALWGGDPCAGSPVALTGRIGEAVASAAALAAIVAALWPASAPAADGDGKRPEAREPSPRVVNVRVFYSSEDPRWPQAAALVSKVAERFGEKVRIETFDIENTENYRLLSKLEKDLRIEPTGEITAVIGNFALTSRGEARRDVEKYLEASVEAILSPKKGPVRGNLFAFAQETFGRSVRAVTPEGPGVALAVFRTDAEGREEAAGWVEEINAEVDCPVCADVAFLVAFDAEGKVVSIKPLREIERYGKPIDASPFLDQFRGRRIDGRWTIGVSGGGGGSEISGISGATKTARLYLSGLKEAWAHFRVYRMVHRSRYRDIVEEGPEPAPKIRGGGRPETQGEVRK